MNARKQPIPISRKPPSCSLAGARGREGGRATGSAASAAGKEVAAPKCAEADAAAYGAAQKDVFQTRLEKEKAERAAMEAARTAFWTAQEARACWSVPISTDARTMPWLGPKERGLLVAVERARSAGKTPLLVDNSRDKVVDTYYAYQSVQVLECKKMFMDEKTGERSHEQAC